jgi:hypothetical protein
MRSLFLILVTAFLPALTSNAKEPLLSDAAARSLVQESLKAEKTLASSCQHLILERRETLENDLLNLRTDKLRGPRLNDDTYIYQVFCHGGYYPLKRKDGTYGVGYVGMSHEGTGGYFVVNRISRRIYHLWLGKDPLAEFNELIREVQVSVSSEAEARFVAKFYRSIVLGPPDDNTLECEVDLREAATHNFHHAFGDAKWEAEFDHWWSGFKKNSGSVSFDETQKQEGDHWIDSWKVFSGFLVAIPRSWTTGRPSVVESTLTVAANGTVRLSTRTLYDNPKQRYVFE